MAKMETNLRIGAAARAAGVHVQTLRYYERRGLLPRPARSVANHRSYDRAAVRKVRAIKRAQELGFTLAEVGELDKLAAGRLAAAQMETLVTGKLAEIDRKLRDLRKMRRALDVASKTCACGGDLGRCDVLDGLGAER